MIASRRLSRAAGMVAVLCTFVGLIGSASAEDWAAVEAAAKKEGTVTYYGTGNASLNVVVGLFEKKYGIRVLKLEGRPSEVQE